MNDFAVTPFTNVFVVIDGEKTIMTRSSGGRIALDLILISKEVAFHSAFGRSYAQLQTHRHYLGRI